MILVARFTKRKTRTHQNKPNVMFRSGKKRKPSITVVSQHRAFISNSTPENWEKKIRRSKTERRKHFRDERSDFFSASLLCIYLPVTSLHTPLRTMYFITMYLRILSALLRILIHGRCRLQRTPDLWTTFLPMQDVPMEEGPFPHR